MSSDEPYMLKGKMYFYFWVTVMLVNFLSLIINVMSASTLGTIVAVSTIILSTYMLTLAIDPRDA